MKLVKSVSTHLLRLTANVKTKPTRREMELQARSHPFLYELDEVLSDKPSTLPKFVINSTKIVEASCCEVNKQGPRTAR